MFNLRLKITSFLILVSVLVFILFWAQAAFADQSNEAIKIAGWVAISPPAISVFAAYLSISNQQNQPIKFMGAKSKQFKIVELHLSEIKKGMAMMKKIEDGITIGANETFVMKPGGYHLMLLKNLVPIKLGDTIKFKLLFNHNLTKSVSLPVKKRF